MPAPKLYKDDTTTSRNLSLATSILRKAENAAREVGISLSQWVTMAMKEKLQKDEINK